MDLAASLMDWEHIRHVPVEAPDGRLVGLVSHRSLLRLLGRGVKRGAPTVAVRDVMTPDPLTVGPLTETLEAIATMRQNRVSCLPVVDANHKLLGIVTERDFIEVAARLFEEKLRTS